MAFLSDITLGQYYPIESFVHRLDPRTKIFTILITMTVLVATHSIAKLVITFILLIYVIKIANLPLNLVLRNIRPFIWLFLITIIFHLFFYNGGTKLLILPFVNIEITQQGLIGVIIYSFRLAELILFASLLTLTTSPIEITDALDRILLPLKKLGLPTHEFTLMMTLSLRFIPTLISEADKLKKAQISRGATFEGNLIKRIKSVISLILPLFISVFRRADELALAMDSRCYVGGKDRTSFKQLSFCLNDYLIMVGSVLFLIASLFLI